MAVVKLITADGFEIIYPHASPSVSKIVTQVHANGKKVGERIYKLDEFRDGEYREVVESAKSTPGTDSGVMPNVNRLVNALMANGYSGELAIQGNTTLTKLVLQATEGKGWEKKWKPKNTIYYSTPMGRITIRDFVPEGTSVDKPLKDLIADKLKEMQFGG